MKKILIILSLFIFTTNAYSNSKFDKDLKKFSKDNGFVDNKGKVYSKLGNVVYNVYKKRFQEMELNEGFYKIYKFLPDIKLKYCFV